MIVILMVLTIITCVYCSVTDIKNGIISNKFLGVMLILGIAVSSVYLWKYVPGMIQLYLFNQVLTIFVSIALYCTHIWAAGDSKMLIVIGVLTTPDFMLYREGYLWVGIIIPIFAFAISFIYTVFETIFLFLKNRKSFRWEIVREVIKRNIITYVGNVIIITCFSKIEMCILGDIYYNYRLFIIILNFLLLLITIKLRLTRQKFVLIGAVLVSVILSVISQSWGIRKEMLWTYFIIILFMVVRASINNYNYEEIEVSKLKKGMIPSAVMVVIFSQSKVQGLPSKCTEDLRARMTEEEVEAVRQWSVSKNGNESIQIVKKVPFAIFISIGVVALYWIWGILNYVG